MLVATNRLTQQLLREQPDLGITAMIIAQDRVGADSNWARAESGKWTWEQAIQLTGSYARFDMAVRAYEAKHVTKPWMYKNLPDLWRSADPDDTDPRYLKLWKAAWFSNDTQPITDGKPLPRSKVLTIYRGQDEGPVGFAWTTDLAIAEKFARGAGLRQSHRKGKVLKGQVLRKEVLAYLTGRNESEVIVDPRLIRGVS